MTTAQTPELLSGLRGFRRVRRLAYECAEAVAARLEPGVTEREAARMQREWLRERVFPTNRRLEPGMPFVLERPRCSRVSRPTSATRARSAPIRCRSG